MGKRIRFKTHKTMTDTFTNPEQALQALSDPSSANWLAAFAYLSQHPETAELMLETFRETLEQMGIAPSGVDEQSGEPAYSLRDVARAMGIPESDLDPGANET